MINFKLKSILRINLVTNNLLDIIFFLWKKNIAKEQNNLLFKQNNGKKIGIIFFLNKNDDEKK
jgi:hypothetical protein